MAQSMVLTSAKRTREIFKDTYGVPENSTERTALASKIRYEYEDVRDLPPALAAKQASAAATAAARRKKTKTQPDSEAPIDPHLTKLIEGIPAKNEQHSSSGLSTALTLRQNLPNTNGPSTQRNLPSTSLVRKTAYHQPKPEWHAPWKLMRVISGHLGWVRALAVEPGNQWFASGAGDRTIKIWDLASGSLRLTLTGHISTVRGLAVSPRHPYLFSCGEDKMVKCWDLETNRVIRHYHGHLSGVYTLALHPTLDVLVTGGRDGVARVWDMRSRSNIHVLSGHKQTVTELVCQEADPQVITASLDSTVRLWDLAAGKTMGVLTHHKKGVRALATHPTEFTFASGSTGSIKQWKCPEGTFMQNFEGQNAIINTLSVNQDNVLFSGGEFT
jgi:pleiotropic regulator 1